MKEKRPASDPLEAAAAALDHAIRTGRARRARPAAGRSRTPHLDAARRRLRLLEAELDLDRRRSATPRRDRAERRLKAMRAELATAEAAARSNPRAHRLVEQAMFAARRAEDVLRAAR